MGLGVTVCGKVKGLEARSRSESECEMCDFKLCAVDPKASDLTMGRLKRV